MTDNRYRVVICLIFLLRAESGATIFMETAAGAPVVLAGNFVALGFGVTVSDRLELIGSKASIILEPGKLKLLGPDECVMAYDLKKEYQTCFDAAIAHFTGCIQAVKFCSACAPLDAAIEPVSNDAGAGGP